MCNCFIKCFMWDEDEGRVKVKPTVSMLPTPADKHQGDRPSDSFHPPSTDLNVGLL